MRYILYIVLLAVPVFGRGQTNTFYRTFGSSNSDFGNNLIRAGGNGFAMTLSTPINPPINSEVNIALLRLDEIGHLIWRQEYIMDSSCYANDLIETPDQGFLIGGWRRNGSFNAPLRAMLMKLNNAGTWQWVNTYTTSPADRIVDVQATNGGYILTIMKNDNVALESTVICKIDPNGNILWTREISFNGEVLPIGSAILSSGEIIVCGTVRPGPFTEIIWTKLTANGVPVRSKWFRTTYDDEPSAIKVNDLDEVYIVGRSYFMGSEWDSFILKTDSAGELKNELFYDSPAIGGDIVRDFDFAEGLIIATGDVGTFDARDPFLALIRTDGSVVWSKKYPLSPTFTNYPMEVISLPGFDGFAFTGDVRTQFASREGVLVKTDYEGEAGCYTAPLPFNPISHNFEAASFFPQYSVPNVTRASVTNITMVADVTEKQVCEYIHPVANFDTSGGQMNCPQYCFDFQDTSKYGPMVSWSWSFPGAVPSSSTDQHPGSICYSASGSYPVTLVVTNMHTSDTLTKTFTVNLQCPVSVPNVFSPNQDGINDIFQIGGLPADFQLTIFNRWGFKVFETSDALQMWNGKFENSGNYVPSGVYFYVLSAESLAEPQHGFFQLFN